MPRKAFAVPRHWEDWLGIALGAWLWASPWVLPYGEPDQVVTLNAFLMGFLLVTMEGVILFSFRAWEEWINVVIGAWLVVSPWVLGIAAPLAVANFIVVGLLVLALAVYELWDVRHEPAHA